MGKARGSLRSLVKCGVSSPSAQNDDVKQSTATTSENDERKSNQRERRQQRYSNTSENGSSKSKSNNQRERRQQQQQHSMATAKATARMTGKGRVRREVYLSAWPDPASWPDRLAG